jgi:16S rRNA (guanine966-N2)-methyltransferase
MRKSTGVRIIAGAFKGRRLAAPPGLETRPLPDRVKQALFDWHVADCCAGSGAFAFEALSRGARCVEAIEPGAHALPILRANAAGLGNPAALVLHPRTFQAVLPQLHDLDLIFADPPFPWYAKDRATLAALLQMGARALAPGGRFVIRGERGATLPELPADLVETDRRTYGRSWLAMLERNPVQPGS